MRLGLLLWPKGTKVKEAVRILYPDITVDYALPQDWADNAWRHGFNTLGAIVWAYPDQCPIWGCPLPLTTEGYATIAALNPEFIPYLNEILDEAHAFNPDAWEPEHEAS